ncbi:uridine kinase [Flavobacteriaceae bacterium UJ101]|nr:uridine kinase [Flavobacteriaceae bacterium UJ101]
MLVIGIAGGTGSGKTTVVNKILQELKEQEIAVLSQDAYYLDNSHLAFSEREKINYDHPRSIDFKLLVNHLRELKKGNAIEQPVYSYTKHTRLDRFTTIFPKDVVIVEGILVFTDQELLDEFDIKVFVHTDSDERLIRRVRRDVEERGRDLDEVLTRYTTTLRPMHNQFIEPTKSFADIIVPNMRRNPVAINILKTVIQDKLINSKP